jgi:hypothetical protein
LLYPVGEESMRWDRERAVAVAFILLAVGSAGYLSFITLNYLNYYPALGQLAVQVDAASIVQGSNWSTIDTRITISNPSDYSGFSLGDAVLSMFFQASNSNDTLYPGGASTNVVQTVGGKLATHSTVSAVIVTQLTPEQASSLQSFDTSHGGQVIANGTLTVQVITFLDPLIGRYSISAMYAVPLQG